jgi:hypothetical protein
VGHARQDERDLVRRRGRVEELTEPPPGRRRDGVDRVVPVQQHQPRRLGLPIRGQRSEQDRAADAVRDDRADLADDLDLAHGERPRPSVDRRCAPRLIPVPEDDPELVAVAESIRRQERRVAPALLGVPARGPVQGVHRRVGPGEVREPVLVVLEVLVGRERQQLVEAVLAREVARGEHRPRVEAEPARGLERDETGERAVGRVEVGGQVEPAVEEAGEREALVGDGDGHVRDCPHPAR